MRRPISSWANFLGKLGFSVRKKKARARAMRPHQLRIEPLEPRQLLAQTIYGYTNDTFVVTADSPHQVWRNGIPYPIYDTNIIINGNGGTDTLTVTGKTANETATISAGSGSLVGSGYQISWTIFWGSVTANGGGGTDSVTMTGGGGINPTTGNPGWTSFYGEGWSSRANNFKYVTVNGNGGADTASLTGSPGQDALTTNGSQTILSDIGYANTYSITLNNYTTVTADLLNQTPTDIALSSTSVAENSPSETMVGTLSTTDPNPGDTFTYSLVSGSGSTDNSSFTISGNELRTAASFDYETKSSYSIRLRSTDQNGCWVEKAFTITVVDVNDAPVLAPIGNRSVDEHATLSFTASATDQDVPTQTLTYSLDAASIALGMTINSTTGEFSWTPTDSHGGGSYPATVTVTDDGTNPDNLTDGETFTITVAEAAQTICGTAGADTIVVTAASPHEVTINGTPYTVFDANLILDGLGGDDTVTLTGTSGDETVTLSPGAGQLVGSDYQITLTNVGSITADGGGGTDSVTMTGSTDVDTLTAGTTSATLTGTGFSNTANSFKTVVVHGNGDSDTADLTGSTGDDTFTSMPTQSILTDSASANTYSLAVNNFKTVVANDNGGIDSATLTGSSASDRLDANSTYALLTDSSYADTFSVRANGFDTVVAGGGGGADYALLHGSSGADTFTANPTSAAVSGSGFSVTASSFSSMTVGGDSGDSVSVTGSTGDDTLTNIGFYAASLTGAGFSILGYNSASGTTVSVNGNGGNDIATFSGHSVGTETLTRTPSYTQFTILSHNLRAIGFGNITANGNGGTDSATLTGSTGNDTFVASPTSAVLSGSGYGLTLNGFKSVSVNGNGGTDTASLTGSTAQDTLTTSYYVQTKLNDSAYANTFSLTLNLFRMVTVDGNSGSDTATLTGLSSLSYPETVTACPTQTVLSSATAPYSITANNFPTVTVNGGSDTAANTATLTGSTGDDVFTASGSSGTLSGTGYSITASHFGSVTVAGNGGSDTATLTGSSYADTLSGAYNAATLSGTSFSNTVQNFATVTANGSGGTDTASLTGSTGDDTLTAGPTSAVLSGSGYSLTANSFEILTVSGNGGMDTATLTGTEGQDTLTGTGTPIVLSDTGYANTYSITVNDFADVDADLLNQMPTDIALSPASVAENSPSGTTVGTFSTTDPNAEDTFTYTLVSGDGDADNSSFTINASGDLVTSASFDYETQPSYSIRVRSTDQGGLWFEKAFTIEVTNVTPTLALDGDATVAAGAIYTLTLAPRVEGTEYAIHWDDGAVTTLTDTELAAAGGQVEHVYRYNPGTYITVDVMDGTQAYTRLATKTVTVTEPAAMTKDICGTVAMSSDQPEDFTPIGDTVFFTARDSSGGRSLWKSDVTGAWSVQVSSIDGGTVGSSPSNLTNANGTLFFTANNGCSGNELWKSDGTAYYGTVQVKDINAGEGNSNPSQLTYVNGTLFFTADDGYSGNELWKSDGTENGTVLVKDIYTGASGSSPTDLTNVNGTLFFVATDARGGTELWKSDGTEAGTVLVKDIYLGSVGSCPSNLTVVNEMLYFAARDFGGSVELWKSDGTEAGTVLVKDIYLGTMSSFPGNLTNVNGTLFFVADDGSHGRELWKSNGAPDGTVLVKDIYADASGSSPSSLTNVNGTLFFAADDGSHGRELWKSNGAPDGTVLVKDIYAGTGNSSPSNLTNVNGTLFFAANDGYSGTELWKTNGTEAGTVLVNDICDVDTGDSSPHCLTNVNGTLFFAATDATDFYAWKSDGTTEGTVRVQESTIGSEPMVLTNVNGTLYFLATDASEEPELWKSDGTAEGTVRVKDINAALGSSSPWLLTDVNGTLFFSAPDGTLWKSDGTAEGTVVVKDIGASNLTNVNGTLFFSSYDRYSGYELGKSDGTEAGTVVVKYLNAGSYVPPLSYPAQFTDVNGTLFFTFDDGSHGRELWKSDGTTNGTVLIKDINADQGSSMPSNLTVVNGTLFFTANDGIYGIELWKSDGTEAGTVLVKDIYAGAGGFAPMELTNVNGTLFFSGDDGYWGRELWKSDGTQAGTVQVKDIYSGGMYSDPSDLTNVNGTLFFTAADDESGFYLWKSNGTEEGTVRVCLSTAPYGGGELTNVNGTLFFTAADESGGLELWKSDGTANGTMRVKDIFPGMYHSQAHFLTDVSGTLFLMANDGVHGHELWSVQPVVAEAGFCTVLEGEDVVAPLSAARSTGGGLLTYEWDFDGDDEFGETSTVYGNEIGISPTFFAGDVVSGTTFPVKLRVTDGLGRVSVDTTTIIVHSVCYWTGGGGNNLWSTATNWVGGEVPIAYDEVVFQGTSVDNVNDFAPGTPFYSVTFAASDFWLTGNSFTVIDNITVNSNVTGAVINTNVALDGALVVNVAGASLAIAGNLSGTGSLSKTGSGNLTLTGNNTYSGGTAIGAGSLYLCASAATLGTGPVANDASLVFAQTGTLQFPNDISGSGSVTQTAGTVILTGHNTYSGVTTINAGATLCIGCGTGTGSLGSGPVVNNGSLVFSRGNTMQVANTISGTGSVTQTSGKVILSGDNSYTGGTIITEGTLRLGSNTALSTPAAASLRIDGGALDLYGHDLTLVSLSGNGPTDGHPGGTIGDLSPTSGTTTLTVNQSDSTTFGGTFRDGRAGVHRKLALIKAGSGTLTLTGNSFNSGQTTIQDGTLAIDGSMTSNITEQGGTVGGNNAPRWWQVTDAAGSYSSGTTSLSGNHGEAGWTITNDGLAITKPLVWAAGWQAAIRMAVSGSVTFSPPGGTVEWGGAFDVGTVGELRAAHSNFDLSTSYPGIGSDDTKLIVVDDGGGGNNSLTSDSDYDDDYWLVNLTPLSTTDSVFDDVTPDGGPDSGDQGCPTEGSHVGPDGRLATDPTPVPGGGMLASATASGRDFEIGQPARLMAGSDSYGRAFVAVLRIDAVSMWYSTDGGATYGPDPSVGLERQGKMTKDANNDFIQTDPNGTKWLFSGTLTASGHLLVSETPANGYATTYAYGANEQLTDTWTNLGDGNQRHVSYTREAGTGALIMTVALTKSGSQDQPVGSCRLEYYGTGGLGDSNGNPGDLKLLITYAADGTPVDRTYYRYYTHVGANNQVTKDALKCILKGQSLQRLEAEGKSYDTATDAEIKPFADNYYEYDGDGRVVKETLAASGCSLGCGQSGTSYAYVFSKYADGPNTWHAKVTKTFSDESQIITFTNARGQVLLEDVVSSTGQHWITCNHYNDDGTLDWSAQPSAVDMSLHQLPDEYGYNSSYSDLHVSLKANEGLIQVYEYYDSTNAPEYPESGVPTISGPMTGDPGSWGGVAGYLCRSGVKQGSGGATVWQTATDYVYKTVHDITVYYQYRVAEYPTAGDSNPPTTTYHYSFYSPEDGGQEGPRIQSVTTILPIVSTAQHGSGEVTSNTAVYDTLGRLVWYKDEGGYLSYTAYDPATGAAIKTIADVNTTNGTGFSDLPSGWTMPPDGGRHLITTMEVDARARTTKQTDPDGTITFTVYNDASHEVRTYAGWRYNSTSEEYYAATNAAITVSREDWANNYTETLTYVWTGAGQDALPVSAVDGRPLGTEPLNSAYVSLQSLSRSLMNDAGQVTQTRDYFNLTGLPYTANLALGALGANYVVSGATFDPRGRLAVTVEPQGTVYHTFFDTLDRVTAQWTGTDDVMTTDYNDDETIDLRDFRAWVAANPTATEGPEGTSMVKLSANIYDSGLAAGDSNLTESRTYFGDLDGPSEYSATSYQYDWRDRMTQITQPDPDAGGPLASPVTEYEYDNAGRAVMVTQKTTNSADPVRETSYEYDSLGRLFETTLPDPDGEGSLTSPVTITTYDSRGNVLTQIDALGNVTSFEYDGLGRLIRQTDPDPDGTTGPLSSPVTEYGYDAAGQVTKVTHKTTNPADPMRETNYEYDALGRLETTTLPDPDGTSPLTSPVTTMTYDSLGNVLTQTDALDHVTSFEYDALGRLTRETAPDPDGTTGPLSSPVTEYQYNAAGQVMKVTQKTTNSSDPVRETNYEYDAWGRLTKTTLPDPDGPDPLTSPETSATSDRQGNVLTQTDAMGNVTTFEYDALGRLIRQTAPDPDGATGSLSSPVTEYQYNAAGQVTKVTQKTTNSADPVRETTYEYDALGRQTRLTQPDPDGAGTLEAARTDYTYDALGRVLTETDRLNHQTSYVYDALGRVTSQTDANNDTTTYTYDSAGNLASLTDAEDNTTTWTYDALGRATEETNELEDTRYFVYDAAGNVVQKTDRNGRVTKYDYDHLNRITAERWMDGQTAIYTITTGYDALGRVVSTSDSDLDATYTFDYDLLDRVKSITSQIAGLTPTVIFSQAYDAASQRTGLSATIGGVADFANVYTLDDLGRLVRVEQSSRTGGNAVAAKRVDQTYDSSGNRATTTRHAVLGDTQIVATSQYTYDLASRLTGLTHSQGATTLAGYGWTYDAANRIAQFVSSTHTDESATYAYDSASQLTGADYSGLTDETYTYDDNGNRTNSGYQTDPNNQLLSDGTYRYEYDGEGNRTMRYVWTDADSDGVVDAGERSQITAYAWDYRNRLTTVTNRATEGGAATQTVSYTYDAANRMVSRSLDADGAGSGVATTSYYVYDGAQVALEFDGSTAADLSHRYLWGQAVDEILADEQVSNLNTPGDVLWPLTDNLGTVRDLATYDSQNDVTTIANHRTYNAYGQMTGETSSAVDCVFGYTGRLYDEATGLQNNLNRWYDAGVGKWLSEDPAKADINLYRYVGNNPVIYVDPTGLWSSGANGVYTHTAITRDAFNRAFPKTRGFENCAAHILDRMTTANNGQDAGSRPFAGATQPGQQNFRHYCRDAGVSKAAADAAYTNYIAGEINTFHNAINAKNPTQANCDSALDAIGRLTHTWEDFYSHAIRNVLQGPGIGPPVFPINRDVVWGDGDPRLNIGDADHPGPDIVAPTFFYPSGGEHGWSEPSSRDLPNGLDRRRAAAVDFVAGRLRTLLLEWSNKCRCYCKD